ncbi:MAG: UvrD-helicase domain-containing protein, partial [Balneolales bacterium]
MNSGITLEQLTHELKKAEGNIVVEAGAGTGKTYNLTNRILHQVKEEGCTLDQILAMTFTDYAAAEMRERVYQAISSAIETEGDEKKRRHLIRQKRDFSKNYISTFHSFCSRILKYYPDEVAEMPITRFPAKLDNGSGGRQATCYLDSGFEILGPYDEILLKQNLLKEFYKIYKDHPPLQTQLNIMRPAILEKFLNKLCGHDEEDLLPIARMSPNGYLNSLGSLLLDMKARQKPVKDQAWAIVEANRHWFKNPEQLQSWDDMPAMITGKGSIRKNRIVNEHKPIVAGRLDPLIKEYCDHNKSIEPLEQYLSDEPKALRELKAYRDNDDFNANHETYHSLIEIADLSLRWSAFMRYKRVSSRTLNFDDIIWFIRRLFIRKPNIARSLSDRFRFIMIDEFQDTDIRQWEIIKALASLNTESKVLVVGDIKQAIYGFRGSNATMMSRTREELQMANPAAYHEFRLSWSFRSNDSVINFVNRLFDFCFNQEEDRQPYMAEAQRLLRPDNEIGKQKNHPGEIRILEGPGPIPELEELSPPARKLFEDDACRMEALRIADFLDRIRKGRVPGYERIAGLMDQGQTAVGMLFKRRKNQHYYEQALNLYGLAFTVSSGRSFFNRQVIMDCNNLLAFLQDAFDDLSFAGVLRSPFVGLSDPGLLTLRNAMDEEGRGKAYPTYWLAARDWQNWGEDAFTPPDKLALGMISFLKELRNKTPYSRVSELLEEAVFDSNFLNGYLRDPQAGQNAIKLIDIIRQLESRGRGNLFEIVNFLRLQMEEAVAEADAELAEPGVIQLMTVHGSKGLEFPMVVLPDMCAGPNQGGSRIYETPVDDPLLGLPVFSYTPKDRDGRGDKNVSAIHNLIKEQCRQREKAELIRLFYVAATRAETHLLLGHTTGYAKGASITKGSFSGLLQDWMNAVSDAGEPDLFVHDVPDIQKIEELSSRVRQGFRIATGQGSQNRKMAGLDKIRAVSDAGSGRVKSVSQAKEGAVEGWAVQDQWITLSAADAGTLVHRALEIDQSAAIPGELMVNLAASLGYRDAERLVRDNKETLNRHLANARACLRSGFPASTRLMKEAAFEVEDTAGAGFIRGTIDLLIRDGRGNWSLIDFKTALPDESLLVEFSNDQGYAG